MFGAPIPIAAGLPFASAAIDVGAPPPIVAQDLREAIGYALAGSADITAIVGPRIYGGHRPPQLAALPRILISIQSDIPGQILSGPDGTAVARVELVAEGLKLADCATVTRALRPIFDGRRGQFFGLFLRWSKKLDEIDLEPLYPDDGSEKIIFRIQTTLRVDYYVPIPAFSY
jgi:hypothetical protein